jgi:hypothetical protein
MQSFGNDCVPSDSTEGVEKNLAQDATKAAEQVFDCRKTFLASLKSRDPEGFHIWDSLKAETKKDKQLQDLFKCGNDGQLSGTDVNTLVHESTHALAFQKRPKYREYAFLRTNGKWFGFIEDPKSSLYENSRGQALRVMSQEERKDMRSKLYLHDSGFETFGELLKELNAYTIGLRTSLRYPKVSFSSDRESPLEMVMFAVRYLEAMKKYSPRYYQTLLANRDLMTSVKALFEDAYSVYNQSCERTDLNLDDMRSIRALQTESSRAVLKTVFGDRAPGISARCVATAKLREGWEVTPIIYPHREAAMAALKAAKAAPRSSSASAVTGSHPFPSSSETVPEKIEVVERQCDPSKPCGTYFYEQQKDGSMKMWGDLKGNHIEQVFAKDGTTIYTWNGKTISHDEFLNRLASDPELLDLNNNSRLVEKSASARP